MSQHDEQLAELLALLDQAHAKALEFEPSAHNPWGKGIAAAVSKARDSVRWYAHVERLRNEEERNDG